MTFFNQLLSYIPLRISFKSMRCIYCKLNDANCHIHCYRGPILPICDECFENFAVNPEYSHVRITFRI